jgi:hypothetical protein
MGRTKAEILAERHQEEYAKEILIPQDQKVIYPIFKKTPTLPEGGFYSEEEPEHAMRGKLTLYGELLWRSILGGVLHKNHHFQRNGSHPHQDYELCQPDISIGKRTFLESKVVAYSNELKLPMEQMKRYEWLQLDPKEQRKTQIKFIVSRHGITGLENTTRRMEQEEWIELFSQSIHYALILPFSISHHLYHLPKKEGIINKPWNPTDEELATHRRQYLPMVRVSSKIINSFFEDPPSTLQILELDPAEYQIRRATLQKGMLIRTMQDHPIKPFPILELTDTNHEQWLERFRESHTQEHEEYLKELERQREIQEQELRETFGIQEPLNDDEVDF